MHCPECRLENSDGANFCYECGHRLTLASKSTSQILSYTEKLENIQRYLPQGIAEKILNQKEKLEGERRQVTVMFCDMEGYTSFAEKLGPEEAYRIMDQIYEILIHNVHDFEGTVNEMTGDGIMALFGAPIALEDAPQRALWSALSIHRDLAGFNAQKKGTAPIKMRIGIHTGPVVVGTLGNDLRVEFKAVGNTVNLAARMEELAEAGTTYVSAEIYRLIKNLFEVEALGRKSVKGMKKSIPVYKVLSGKKNGYRPQLGSERMIYCEMVGREKEINRLELQVMKLVNGEGSVVNIVGEAGIGKSRLVAELKKRDVMKRVNLFEGRAISMGRNLGYYPIIDLLKQWARITEDDGEAMAFGKLEAAVRNLYPETFSDVLPFIGILMGMKPSGRYADRIRGIEGEALEKLILKNVRALLIKASALTPLVIVTEDIHWADTSSIELLESLFRLAETEKILFVNVFRPGYSETGDRLAETIKSKVSVYYVEIMIEPLDNKLCEILIGSMLNISEFDHAVFEKILQRSGGNPFFIEEVVRSLIDERAVTLKNGTFHATDKMGTIAIPNSISDVLMARVDRLEEKTRNLVKIASVIGRTFFYRVLSEVANSVEDLDRRLTHLKEIQLFRERQRMGEVEYLFKHALAQEAAYDSILPRKRRKLHLKVAASIERIFAERLHEFYGMLAFHYSRAENLEKAEEYLIKAGEEALKSSASIEALNYYQEALGLYLKIYGASADPEKIAMLDKNIAMALYNKGRCEGAVKYFDKALTYYWGQLPRHSISASFCFLSALLHFVIAMYLPSLKFRRIPTQRDMEIVDLFYKKCEALGIINPKRFFMESLCICKEVTRFDLKNFDLGLKVLVGASALFSFTGFSFNLSKKILDTVENKFSKNDAKLFIIFELMETVHKYLQGNWKAIKNYNEDLLNKNLNMGELYVASHHLFWHGLPCIYQGSLDLAESLVNRLNNISKEYENDVSIMLKRGLNTSLLTESRRLHEALLEIEKGIEYGQKANQSLSLLHMFSCKARIQILMGDMKQAKKSLKQTSEIRKEVDTAPWQLSNFRKGKLEYDICRLSELTSNGGRSVSFEYHRQAYKSCKMLLKESRKVAQHRTEAYKLKGVYYWLINKQRKALKWWNKSIKEGERLGARLELSRTYFEVGKRLREPQSRFNKLNGTTAEEYLDRARAMFEEMDLQWDLDGLAQLTGS